MFLNSQVPTLKGKKRERANTMDTVYSDCVIKIFEFIQFRRRRSENSDYEYLKKIKIRKFPDGGQGHFKHIDPNKKIREATQN